MHNMAEKYIPGIYIVQNTESPLPVTQKYFVARLVGAVLMVHPQFSEAFFSQWLRSV